MSYQIAVCIKPVPDPKHYDRVTIDPIRKTINRKGIASVPNPVDKNAVEAALVLRERYGGSVTAICMAPPEARDNLLEVLAMGADSTYLLSDLAFGGADTLATSYTLACGLKRIESETGERFDFILCGCESADGATAQVPAQLGEWMGIPHLWNVSLFDEADGSFEGKASFCARTKIENGYMEWSVRPPVLLGVARELNRPRFTSVMGVMKARRKPFVVWGRDDLTEADDRYLGLSGSPTKAGVLCEVDLERSGEYVCGSTDEAVDRIVQALRVNGALLRA